jgi:hypothetical protein
MSSILRPGDDTEKARQYLAEDLARWQDQQLQYRIQYKVRETIWTAEMLAPLLLQMEQVATAIAFIEAELAALPTPA